MIATLKPAGPLIPIFYTALQKKLFDNNRKNNSIGLAELHVAL